MSRFDRRVLNKFFLAVLFLALAIPAQAAQWTALGPDGGDARSFAYDPHNPDRIFMGTMAGKMFLSTDGGATWNRFAHFGNGDDYVLDRIVINPANPKTIYVAAWSVTSDGGDIFRSKDGGKNWDSLDGVHGKSLRALAMAPSNPKIIVAGAIDGVYRSSDGGDSWARITPEHHAELKNVQSVAIDPKNPDVIYVGTWHLPWKTEDGGSTWKIVKKGMIDDSDVFSIIIDPNPAIVYASACSGIYKSETSGELFHKVQGMPFSARRTRVLKMDPNNPQIVYAGTTEGLWKTMDGGKTFRIMTSPSVVVNDIMVDPRDSNRVLLATDRGGVLRSEDGAVKFTISNHGFAHRQVAALLIDRSDPEMLYAGIVNDKEFGGVFVSRDSGAHWNQMSSGLSGRDVFTLRQIENGTLIAGTNHGIFEQTKGSELWLPINTVVTEKEVVVRVHGKKKTVLRRTHSITSRSQLAARVNDLALNRNGWYAATATGLFHTTNDGRMWEGGEVAGQQDFVAVRVREHLIAAASRNGVAVSVDGGAHWYAGNVPHFVTGIHDLAIGPENSLWIASREGVFRSADSGDNWEHVLGGLPGVNVNSITYEPAANRMLATSSAMGMVYASADGGHHWQPDGDAAWEVRSVTTGQGRMFVTTAYDGILTQSDNEQPKRAYTAGNGGSTR